jgi:hypothetical protein
MMGVQQSWLSLQANNKKTTCQLKLTGDCSIVDELDQTKLGIEVEVF